MEIGHTSPIGGIAPATSAWADTPLAGDAVAATDDALPPAPGQTVEHTIESAAVQTVMRPPVTEVEVHNTDDVLPTQASVDSEFAAPAALLVPTLLVGLQVEAAASWPMPWRGFDPPLPRVERETEQEHQPPSFEPEHVDEDAAEDDDTQAHADDAAPEADETAVENRIDTDWCEPLTRTLRSALASRVPPQAVLVAGEQWQRGRCVVLACPQGDDPAGPAWAFVLWPRRSALRAIDGVAPPLSLHGLRVDARLQWSALPTDAHWCHVRVVKEHHPRTGRQLISLDDAASAGTRRPVPCEVQLGPVLARSLRWCEVCLRIQAAQRFWAALGAQWSVHVVVSSRPLIAPIARDDEEMPAC
jgi:hypothetical protein